MRLTVCYTGFAMTRGPNTSRGFGVVHIRFATHSPFTTWNRAGTCIKSLSGPWA